MKLKDIKKELELFDYYDDCEVLDLFVEKCLPHNRIVIKIIDPVSLRETEIGIMMRS